MANSLLDFVMALVRDPDAAARYAADPAQALADAHLTDVTSADVQSLIPVVTESLSMSTPMHTLDDVGVGTPDGNIWSSGAATAAFDAFDDHLPDRAVIDTHPAVPEVVSDVDTGLDSPLLTDIVDTSVDTASAQFDEPLTDDIVSPHTGLTDDWSQSLPDSAHHGQGFDVFD